mgnify:CR=1 FL=1
MDVGEYMNGPTCDPKTHPSPCACCEWRLTVELPAIRAEVVKYQAGSVAGTAEINRLQAESDKILEAARVLGEERDEARADVERLKSIPPLDRKEYISELEAEVKRVTDDADASAALLWTSTRDLAQARKDLEAMTAERDCALNFDLLGLKAERDAAITERDEARAAFARAVGVGVPVPEVVADLQAQLSHERALARIWAEQADAKDFQIGTFVSATEILKARVEALRQTVLFFASAIKSGESWTLECQAAFNVAIQKVEGGAK